MYIFPEWPQVVVVSNAKVAESISGSDCTDLYCASGTQGIMFCKGWGVLARKFHLESLTPLSVAGCGRLQLALALGVLQ